jgi:uncharacterized metal-binding protein YceD (DUF177 family)
MSYLDIYTIPFKNLDQGKVYSYDFKVDQRFFEEFPYSELHNADVDVHVDLVVNPDSLKLDFHLQGQVEVTCDVCLGKFMHPIDYKTVLIVRFADFTTEWFDYDDQIFLSRYESRINIAKHIYDFINLALPIRKVHPLDENGNPTCDPEMLKRLEELSPSKHDEQDIDPRWEQLKNLLN